MSGKVTEWSIKSNSKKVYDEEGRYVGQSAATSFTVSVSLEMTPDEYRVWAKTKDRELHINLPVCP